MGEDGCCGRGSDGAPGVSQGEGRLKEVPPSTDFLTSPRRYYCSFHYPTRESHLPNPNGPLGKLKCLGGLVVVQTGFPGLDFRQFGMSKVSTFCGLADVSHQYLFINVTVFLVDQ